MPLISLFHRSIIATLPTPPVVAGPGPSFIMSRCALNSGLSSVTEWLKHYCHWAPPAPLATSTENWSQSILCVECETWLPCFLRVIDILWTLTGRWGGPLRWQALRSQGSITVRLHQPDLVAFACKMKCKATQWQRTASFGLLVRAGAFLSEENIRTALGREQKR